jgi:hypothetical protein
MGEFNRHHYEQAAMVDDIGSYLEKCLASMPHPNIAKTVR